MALALLFAALASVSLVTAVGPFDPEETLFIFARCMEDNLKDDSSRQSTFLKWKEWELEPADDQSTHCHVKCVFEKLGLYDPSSGEFNPEVIEKQWEKYPDLVEKNKADAYAEALKNLPKTEDDCTAVFKSYEKVHKEHKEASRNLLHGNRQLFNKLYQELGGNIRQMGQSYFEFCENKYYPAGSVDRQKLCQIRQYAVLDDDRFKEHTECIMKGLRYMTKDNKLDRAEIKRDFQQVNKNTVQLEKVLDGCQTKEPNEESHKAWFYYKCLVESPVAEDFKEAFDYREVRSQNYAYHLIEKQKYSKAQVESQVMEIDGKQCPQ